MLSFKESRTFVEAEIDKCCQKRTRKDGKVNIMKTFSEFGK